MRAGRSSHPWPTTSANLQIVETWASRASLAKRAACWLDGEEVPAIGPDLEPYGRVRTRPNRLRENNGVAFRGSEILGLGFTLSPEQKHELIAHDIRNAQVVQPYVIGRDLNQRPDCSASRWVINFRDWPLEKAEEYPDCLSIVQRLVKPGRERYGDNRSQLWWQYERTRPELYRTIEKLDQVLALALVSNSIMPVRVATGPVFAHKCAVFALDDFASLAMLSSSAHSTWTIRYTSTMRTDINYSPSDVFLTLPRPKPTAELHELGDELDHYRRELMLGRWRGLTTTYNHVHDPDYHDSDVQNLRDIHVAIDEAVMRAYGWGDLDLKIGHHQTKIGIRWTVSKEARFELLDRLLEENLRRWREENP